MKFDHEKQQFEIDGSFYFPLSIWKLDQSPDGTPRLSFSECAPLVVELEGYTIAEIKKLMKPPKKLRRKKNE